MTTITTGFHGTTEVMSEIFPGYIPENFPYKYAIVVEIFNPITGCCHEVFGEDFALEAKFLAEKFTGIIEPLF